MNTQKFLVSGIAGGIVSFFAGYLVYGLVMVDFFNKNIGSVPGVIRTMDQMVWWALITGCIFMGLTYSYIFGRANINTLPGGASAGAVIGLLMTAGFDLIMFASTNIYNLTGTVVDVLTGAIMGALTGAAVGMANGWGKKTAVA